MFGNKIPICPTTVDSPGTSPTRLEPGLIRAKYTSGRGAARAEHAQGTPTQSHISPSILVYEEQLGLSFSDARTSRVSSPSVLLYRGTSLIGNSPPLGPYSRTTPGAHLPSVESLRVARRGEHHLRRRGGRCFLCARYPCSLRYTSPCSLPTPRSPPPPPLSATPPTAPRPLPFPPHDDIPPAR